MRKIDPFQRREEILALLHHTPLATALIAQALDIDPMEVKSDLAFLKRHNLLHDAGRMPAPRADGVSRMSVMWGADLTFTAEELEQRAYGRNEEKSAIPDLPQSLLTLMGYTTQEPARGRPQYASKMQPVNEKLKPMRIWPGTSWPMMETAL